VDYNGILLVIHILMENILKLSPMYIYLYNTGD